MGSMFRSGALAVLALSPTAAYAASPQAPPGSGWPPPTDTIIVTGAPARTPFHIPDSESASPGVCDGFLPLGHADKQAVGTTLFWYRVTPGGKVRDVKLYRSSGNTAFDTAALACADGSYRTPAIISGNAAEVVSIGAVDWAHRPFPNLAASPDGNGQNCGVWYPPVAVRNGQQGSVTVGYRIAGDGSATDATIVDSSGSRALDAASLKCVAAFRYYPSYQNDQPVEVDRSVRFEWRLEGFPR